VRGPGSLHGRFATDFLAAGLQFGSLMRQHHFAFAALCPGSVLVVDDEPGVRELFARWLLGNGYEVRTASTAHEALMRVRDQAPAVALCDIRMPGHDGIWLAEQIRRESPDTAVIVASGQHDPESAASCGRHGVLEYLTKPFGRDRLRESVELGVEWHKTAREARLWRTSLEEEVAAKRERLRDALSLTIVDSDAALDRLLCSVTQADPDAYAHAYRVAALAASVGAAMKRPAPEMAAIDCAALLHDFGKLAMPHAVLRKPAPLTAGEQDLIRRHPQIAYELIADVPYLAAAAPLVRDAHERIDGKGFPNGARAALTPLGARIISVADAFDTMTRPRVFRDAIAPADAMLELERCAGRQFDAEVVATFKRVVQA
jgi:putative two-component system response regulator